MSALLLTGLPGCGKTTHSTASLISEADGYQSKGDHAAALIQLKNAASQSPDDGEVRMRLATVYTAVGDIPSAEKEIRRAIALGLPTERTAPVLVKVLLAQEKPQEALAESEKANAKPSTELTAVRGTAYLMSGQLDKAKAAFDQVIALQPNNVTALLGQAGLAVARNDLATATRYADDAIAKHPANTDALQFRVSLQRSQGKNEDAIATLTKIIALEPKHRSAYLDKANLEIATGKLDAAKADIASAAKITPGSVMVNYLQALLDFNLGKYQTSLESMQKVLRVAPDHLPTLYLAASAEMRLEMYDQAERHFRSYLLARPDFVPVRGALAALLAKVQRPAEALVVLDPLLKNAEGNAELLTLAGQVFLQMGDYPKAKTYFTKALVLQPKQAPLHMGIAMTKLGTGDTAGALVDLQQAIDMDPSQEDPAILLADTELGLRHFDKAQAAVDGLLKVKPNSAMAHDAKGRIYGASGDTVNAYAAFDKALAAQPDYFLAAGHAARLALANKQPEVAKQRLQAFLAKNPTSAVAMSSLAELAVSQGKPEEARSLLEKAATEQPDSVPLGLALGRLYMQQNAAAKAEAVARKMQIANPSDPMLTDLLGQAQAASGNPQGALESFSKLASLAPKSAQAQYRMAAMHLELNNGTAAVEDLRKAVALQPNFHDANAKLALLLLERGDSAGALSIARQLQKTAGQAATGHLLEGDILMVQKKPDLATAQYKLAMGTADSAPVAIKLFQAMVAAGKTKAADEMIAQWEKAHADDLLVPMFRAETTLKRKDYQGAAAQFEGLLKRSPNNLAVLNNLAWAYLQLNDPKALQTAEQASAIAPQQPEVMDTLGWILVQQNNTARGLPILQKAAALAPKNTSIRAHLAAAMSKPSAATTAK